MADAERSERLARGRALFASFRKSGSLSGGDVHGHAAETGLPMPCAALPAAASTPAAWDRHVLMTPSTAGVSGAAEVGEGTAASFLLRAVRPAAADDAGATTEAEEETVRRAFAEAVGACAVLSQELTDAARRLGAKACVGNGCAGAGGAGDAGLVLLISRHAADLAPLCRAMVPAAHAVLEMAGKSRQRAEDAAVDATAAREGLERATRKLDLYRRQLVVARAAEAAAVEAAAAARGEAAHAV
eukprot:scaffold24654_cov101-Isochrysis_galbana.AAC.1